VSTFTSFPGRAAFLAECEQVRRRAAITYAATDTPAVLATRRRDAHEAAAHRLPWEGR